MLDFLTSLVMLFGVPGICYILYLGLKLITTILICKHPELSNEKVKHITRMVSKDKHNN